MFWSMNDRDGVYSYCATVYNHWSYEYYQCFANGFVIFLLFAYLF